MAQIEGLPDGVVMVRWGMPDLAAGEYLFQSGAITDAQREGLVVKADTGFSIGLNHYTNGFSVSQNLATPQILYVKVTLSTTQHQEIWTKVSQIASAEGIPVELLSAPPA